MNNIRDEPLIDNLTTVDQHDPRAIIKKHSATFQCITLLPWLLRPSDGGDGLLLFDTHPT